MLTVRITLYRADSGFGREVRQRVWGMEVPQWGEGVKSRMEYGRKVLQKLVIFRKIILQR